MIRRQSRKSGGTTTLAPPAPAGAVRRRKIFGSAASFLGPGGGKMRRFLLDPIPGAQRGKRHSTGDRFQSGAVMGRGKRRRRRRVCKTVLNTPKNHIRRPLKANFWSHNYSFCCAGFGTHLRRRMDSWPVQQRCAEGMIV